MTDPIEELDHDLMATAATVLGTSGIAETVNAALSDVVRRSKLEALAKQEFPDLSLETIKEMRRPRSFDHLRG